ncbi:MAG: type VI secretion system tip protein VgrG [Burkholderiales bacterium]|nr:type VI secretion system tip protein VgrG [Burkholderiales bacterium]
MQEPWKGAARALSLSGAILDREDIPPFQVVSLEGEEAINSLFEYRVVVQTPEREPGRAPWQIDLPALVGQPLTVHLELEGAGTFEAGALRASGRAGRGAGVREISGAIAAVRRLGSDTRHLTLELSLRPGLWEATLGCHHHSFQDCTVVEVLDAVLGHYPWPVDKRLIETYPVLDLVTQCGESDWDFCCRLMEQSGINHHFEHAGGTHRLILSDHNAAFRPFGDEEGPYAHIPLHPPGHRIDREYIHAFVPAHGLVSTAWEGRDHNYTRPRQPLVTRQGALIDNGQREASHPRREVYQWRLSGAGGSAGALWSQPDAGRDTQAHARDEDTGRWLARIRLEELVQTAERAEGEGHIRGVVPGCSFHLQGHGDETCNAEHIILWAHLSVQAPGQDSQAPGAPDGAGGSNASGASGHWRIHTRFTTQPTRTALRPALTRAKPCMSGPETALVVGPQAGQVHTDHLGRIKVWHPAQRRHPQAPEASIWVRVVQPWAGNQQGVLLLPRAGQEVMLGYEGGDPDRPIVLGSVYNGANLPGWNLPGQHALSGFRTRELGEGGGNSAGGRSNHLAMDDTKGEIQVQLKSDHQHSSLSLGSIVRIEDREGRKDARGEGAELRTDGHGAIRAARGLMLTTEARNAAHGGMKEVTEALHRLAQALERHEQLAQGAQAHNVQDEGDQEAVARALRRQGEDIRGTGEALGEFTAPHLLIDSAAGIQTSAAGSTQQASGEHHAIASGGHTSIAAGGSHLVSADNAIRMFARSQGVRVHAAERDVEVQAQAGSVDIRAHDTIRLKARRIELEATEVVLVNGNGSHSQWQGSGIVHGTNGGWTVHREVSHHTGPLSLPVAPMQFPQGVCKECLAAAARQRSRVALA